MNSPFAQIFLLLQTKIKAALAAFIPPSPLAATTLNNGGSDFAINDTFTVNGGITLAICKVTAIAGDGPTGACTDYIIVSPGTGYSIANDTGTTATIGIGTGLVINITDVIGGLFIDMDYGQLEIRDRPAVLFPGVLIDFPEWSFSDLSNLVQQAEGNISLKLFTNPYSGTESNTPTEFKEYALNILDLEYALYKALEGWSPSPGSIGPLGRINYRSDNRRPGLKVRILTFSCSFQDYSAKRTQTLITAPPPTITFNG